MVRNHIAVWLALAMNSLACLAAGQVWATRPSDAKDVERVLAGTDSAAKTTAIQYLANHLQIAREMDDSALTELAKCADDPSPELRSATAVLVGLRWVQMRSEPSPSAVAIELKLAEDPDLEVRHDAVSAGLKFIKDKSDEVVSGLVQAGMDVRAYDERLEGQIIFALEGVAKQRLVPLLERYWRNCERDPDRATWAYVMYLGATGEEPPGVERLEKVGKFIVPIFGKGGFERKEIEAEVKKRLPAGVAEEIILGRERGRVFGELVVNGVGKRRLVIAMLAKSHEIEVEGDVSRSYSIATPQGLARVREAAKEADQVEKNAGATTRPGYLATFNELYEHLGRVYPNFQMKGIDWKKVGQELLPRAAKVHTDREFGLLVEELVARLEDSHAIVEAGSELPPDPDLPEWDPGVACLIDDKGNPVVYVVESGSPAEAAGLRVGMTVVSVNGVPAKEAMDLWMREQRKYFGYSSDRLLEYDAARGFLQQYERGTDVTMGLEDINGRNMVISAEATIGTRYLPRLPMPRKGIEDAANVSWTLLGNGVGYIYVRRIQTGLEESLDQALRDFGDIKGLIIDVRGNSGGGFDSDTAIRNFDLSPANVAEPGRPRYRGPIALLIDEKCISAGEGWSSWFIANKRARVFGTTTAGASSRKEAYQLANGMYQVVVPLKAYSGFLDRPIERRGLEPDVEVRCNAGDLARGRDTVVETARDWLMTAKMP
jgi:carboxyl-terminal processing protease